MKTGDVFFPQRCDLLTYTFSSRGILYVVMALLDQLLIFMEETLWARGSLLGDTESDNTVNAKNGLTKAFTMRQIRLCDFSDNIRVAVLAVDQVIVVDVNERDTRLKCRRLLMNGPSGDPMFRRCESGPTYSTPVSSNDGPASLWLSRWSAGATCSKELREAVDAEFVSISTLAIIFSDEAVIVELCADCDIVKWRTWGFYSTLAVCRTNMHLAFASRLSVVEVFPLKITGFCKHVAPTYEKTLSHCNLLTKSDGCVLSGVSASLGRYKILAIEWHCIASHTLLCVTCQHPDSLHISVCFFTLQFLTELVLPPWRRNEIATTSLAQQQASAFSLQLIPAGTVFFDSSLYSNVRTRIVPNFSRFCDAASLTNAIEFFCVGTDGTVSIVSCQFGKHNRGVFFKQRAEGPKYLKLFLSLQESYGEIVCVNVLPAWRPRVLEFGTFTPQAEQLLGCRRYRVLLHFANGMVSKVMVDPLLAIVRVEAFLTLGVDRSPLHLSSCRGPNGEIFLLGLSRKRLFVVEQLVKDHGISETRVLALSPFYFAEEGCKHPQKRHKCITPFSHTAEDAVCEAKEEGRDTLGSLKNVSVVLPSAVTRGNDTGSLLASQRSKQTHFDQLSVYAEKTSGRCFNSSSGEDFASVSVAPVEKPHSSSTFPVVTEFQQLVDREEENKKVEDDGNLLTVRRMYATLEGLFFSTTLFVNDTEKWWCIPTPVLESLAAARGELLVSAARFPSTVPVRRLNTSPCEECCFDDVRFEWVEESKSIMVRAASLPDDPPLSFCLSESYSSYRVVQIKATRLLNNDVIVGVMCTMGGVEQDTLLLLYGLNLLCDISATPRFVLELVIDGLLSFALCENDNLLVLRHKQRSIERWSRIVNYGDDGYCWKRDFLQDVVCQRGEITSMTLLMAKVPELIGEELQLGQLFFSSSDGDFIYLWNAVYAQQMAVTQVGTLGTNEYLGMQLYHPTGMLLLLAMWRPRVVALVLERLLKAVAGVTTGGNLLQSSDAEAMQVARELCYNPVGIQLCVQPSVTRADFCAPSVRTILLHVDEEFRRLLLQERSDGSTFFASDLPLELLEQVIERLPTIDLLGLSSQEQMAFFCVVDAMHATRLFSVSVDAAASRFFFLHRLYYLQRRLYVNDALVDGFSGSYAAAFMWASVSDAQPQLLDELFGGQDKTGPLLWAEVESAGVPFWLHSLQSMRLLAERVARKQYHTTKNVRECALMYILAGKVGVLAALCKAEQNTKLQAFFLRNFSESKNRTAASSNAFAAVSKNMVQYGAAFFVLAGEARNAAQVILQRSRSVGLAFFVLRLAGGDDREDLLWFMEQRSREETEYGLMSVWEEACLFWRCGEREKALSLFLDYVPRHAVETADILSLLRYEQRRLRGELLPPSRELVLLMRVTRVLLSTGMQLQAMMCCSEADLLLAYVRREQELKRGELEAAARQPKKTVVARVKGNFDTGTLTFYGFDSDDEDNGDYDVDEGCSDVVPANANDSDNQKNAFSSLPKFSLVDNDRVGNGLIDAVSLRALETELSWIRDRLQKVFKSCILAEGCDCGDSGDISAVIACSARMTADIGRRVSDICVEKRLSSFLRALFRVRNSNTCTMEETPLLSLIGVASRLVLVTLYLALLHVSIQNTDYALANALLGYATTVEVLSEQQSHVMTLNTVASIVLAIRGVQSSVQLMMEEHLQRNVAAESEIHSFSCTFQRLLACDDIVLRAQKHEEKLRMFVIFWCAAFVQLRMLKQLREEVKHLRGVLEGFSSPPQYTKLLLWLLGCMLCRVTLAFNASAAQLIGIVVSVLELDDSFVVNPNGVFIEEELELRNMAELLESNLCIATDRVEVLQQLSRQTVLLDLCVSRAEFFWQLPLTETKLSAHTDEIVRLLEEATKPHAAAHLFYAQLSNSALNTLRFVESAWLRCHHTHRSYRALLMEFGLCKGLAQLTTTDRLVLHQASHAVCSLDYDHLSCDSLVWGTDAGAGVSHGYREILVGDNQAALQLDRGGCSIAAPLVLNDSCVTDDTGTGVEKTILEKSCQPASLQRPRFPFSAFAKVLSHPHLPYFVTPHNERCVDLYSFTSTECLATFSFHGDRIVTPVSYSLDGNVFLTGLADGGVVGWRFNLNASKNDSFFVHQFLPYGGVKLAFFCGNQTSLIIVAGFDYGSAGSSVVPAKGKNNKVTEKGLFGSIRFENYKQQAVGVLLLVDLLQEGERKVVVRRELPFVPECGVFLAGPDLAMCVAADGRVVLFDVWQLHLYVLGAFPPMSPRVAVSCIAVSYYDNIVAIGTENGHALLLFFRTILNAMAACLEETGSCDQATVTYVAEENILYKASRLQLAPTLTSHSSVCCMVFTPSVLLAGLGDGKLVAVTLVPNVLRKAVMM